MKITKIILIGLMLNAAFLLPTVRGRQAGERKTEISVLELKAVPDGHYLLNLQNGTQERLINLEVKNDAVKCVNSSDPQLKGLEGKFRLIGNGAFTVFLKNENHKASQLWLFRQDGSATVKEVPDRGEQQKAERVESDSLKRPKTAR